MGYKDPEKAAAYAREWRAKHPERAREIDEKKRKKQPVGWATEKMRIWRIENPEKAKAQADRGNVRIKERLATDLVYAEERRKKRAAYMAAPGVRERRREQWKDWMAQKRASDPEHWAEVGRANNYRKNYGLTVEQYDAMVAAQDGKCAICRIDKPGGRGEYWHVDHCHDRDQIRELLCHNCNTGLGHFKDDPELLRAAAAYLERHSQS